MTKHRDWRTQLVELRDFMSSWIGKPVGERVACSKEVAGSGIPRVLSDFLSIMGGGGTSELFTQNRFIPLSDLELKGERFLFYIENQGVYLSATDGSSDNPPVYGRFNDGEDVWQLEEEALAGFLCQACMFEAMMKAPQAASRAWCDKSELDVILQDWTRSPFGSWRWPGYPSEFYLAPGALALVSPNVISGEAGFSFWCGARDVESISFMKAHVTDLWDYSSF